MTRLFAALMIIAVISISGCTSTTIDSTSDNQIDTTPYERTANPVYPRPCRSILLLNETCALVAEESVRDLNKCPWLTQEPAITVVYSSFTYDQEDLSLERATFEAGCERIGYQKLIPKTKGTHTIIGHLVNGKGNVSIDITVE